MRLHNLPHIAHWLIIVGAHPSPLCKEPGDDPREVLCSGVVAALGKLGYVPWGVNCSTIRYTGAHGCEADMTFVRPQSFDEKLVRSLCVPMRSCGPNAWSKRLVAHPDFRVWASQ